MIHTPVHRKIIVEACTGQCCCHTVMQLLCAVDNQIIFSDKFTRICHPSRQHMNGTRVDGHNVFILRYQQQTFPHIVGDDAENFPLLLQNLFLRVNFLILRLNMREKRFELRIRIGIDARLIQRTYRALNRLHHPFCEPVRQQQRHAKQNNHDDNNARNGCQHHAANAGILLCQTQHIAVGQPQRIVIAGRICCRGISNVLTEAIVYCLLNLRTIQVVFHLGRLCIGIIQHGAVRGDKRHAHDVRQSLQNLFIGRLIDIIIALADRLRQIIDILLRLPHRALRGHRQRQRTGTQHADCTEQQQHPINSLFHSFASLSIL